MRFLIDAQLPPSFADWLRSRDHVAGHVLSLLGLEASDAEIWDVAIAGDYVIVTKDRDFVEWARARSPKAPVVWVRLGNMRRDILTANLEAVWDQVEAALAGGVGVVEVRVAELTPHPPIQG